MPKKILPQSIGIIAEDKSDVETIEILLKRIASTHKGIKPFVGKGCGKIKRKCNAWAHDLKKRGCSALLIIHDSDRNDPDELKKLIRISLHPCPISNHLICIPVQEIEAWLLSDSNAIKTALKLRKSPKKVCHPESVESPKEFLESLVEKASNGEKVYLPTKHNSKIAEYVSIDALRSSCTSFVGFYDFAVAL